MVLDDGRRKSAIDAYNSIAELGAQRGRDKRRKQQEDWNQFLFVVVSFVIVLAVLLLFDLYSKTQPPKHPVFDD